MATSGATIVAADVRASRVGLIRSNVAQLELSNVAVVTADGSARRSRPPASIGVARRPVLRPGDAGSPPMPGGGPAESVARLAQLQRSLVDTLLPLVRPGGTFVYSVCTLSSDETIAIDRYLAEAHPELVPIESRVCRGPPRGGAHGCCPGRGHRRHVPPPAPCARRCAGRFGRWLNPTCRCSGAKILTVSDGVVAGAEDLSG
jgi:16S rRNA C967 or C1407 C5-methylase (RsmB/RsmF family)